VKLSSVPEPVKAVVHLGSRSYGRLTAEQRMLPTFLVCGGQRCGTTSMYRALAAHPAVLKAVLHKGVHYFDVAYSRGQRWYRGHFPTYRQAARIERDLGVPVQTFESSPYYMYHPHAMARIATDLPAVKLVVLVRDPVERAYSQHAHEVARGFETEPDFAKALALEPERLSGVTEKLLADPDHYSFSHQHHAYRARGEYVRYLRRMAEYIGRDHIHVVDSHEFFRDPKPAYDAVLDFLGLPKPTEVGAAYPAFEQHNARPRLPLPDDLRDDLTTHFAPYDDQLAEWLGRTPSWQA
jgi:sulfotransferase family protein